MHGFQYPGMTYLTGLCVVVYIPPQNNAYSLTEGECTNETQMKSSVWSCVLIISVPGVSHVMCLLRVNSAALQTLGEYIQ